uniref:Putative peptidase family m13 n=1 Tax=Rhipicephalus microplus TaxID=6941 RepID=A0A6G4ZYM5_RHIMP
MNANLGHEELEELADTLIHFEGQLANLTTPPEKRRNVLTLYHRTTIDELEKNFTQIPLGYLIAKELSEVNITVAGNETIQQLAMDYYRKLDEFLRSANCTTLFNYAGLREVLKWAALASEEFRNASFELTRAVMGVLEEKPRWEECVHTVNSAMPEIVGYLYVLRKFTEEAKQEVEDIVKESRLCSTKLFERASGWITTRKLLLSPSCRKWA